MLPQDRTKKDQSVGEVISKAQLQPLSLKEVLESYNHITLTDDEMIEAIIGAKIKKEEELRLLALRERERANREMQSKLWDNTVIKSFMLKRAEEIFDGKFILDEQNEKFFEILCYYFTGDNEFIKIAAENEIENPSLSKGLLIAGNFGTGKTWMMKLFSKNARQTYWMRSAKEIAQGYLNSGKKRADGSFEDKKIPIEYIELFKNAVNDAAVFYQPLSGLCIDDLGSESKKNNFGNVMNVVGDLIEERYYNKNYGLYLHATTNLSSIELKDFYGERVVSRMREIFNFIELPGTDRRK
jgi:DNA replication protein DnaC